MQVSSDLGYVVVRPPPQYAATLKSSGQRSVSKTLGRFCFFILPVLFIGNGKLYNFT
jgi:hypothetical protein